MPAVRQVLRDVRQCQFCQQQRSVPSLQLFQRGLRHSVWSVDMVLTCTEHSNKGSHWVYPVFSGSSPEWVKSPVDLGPGQRGSGLCLPPRSSYWPPDPLLPPRSSYWPPVSPHGRLTDPLSLPTVVLLTPCLSPRSSYWPPVSPHGRLTDPLSLPTVVLLTPCPLTPCLSPRSSYWLPVPWPPVSPHGRLTDPLSPCLPTVVLLTPCLSPRSSYWPPVSPHGRLTDPLSLPTVVLLTPCLSPRSSYWPPVSPHGRLTDPLSLPTVVLLTPCLSPRSSYWPPVSPHGRLTDPLSPPTVVLLTPRLSPRSSYWPPVSPHGRLTDPLSPDPLSLPTVVLLTPWPLTPCLPARSPSPLTRGGKHWTAGRKQTEVSIIDHPPVHTNPYLLYLTESARHWSSNLHRAWDKCNCVGAGEVCVVDSLQTGCQLGDTTGCVYRCTLVVSFVGQLDVCYIDLDWLWAS